MKKFRFSLQTLLNIKESLKKQRQAELAQAQAHAERCRRALESTQKSLQTRMSVFSEKMAKGMGVEEMQQGARHFVFLRERIERQKAALAEALEILRQRREAVIEVMQEVKMLEKLREKQFELYLDEMKKEAEKEIGDFVSYMVGSAETVSEGEN